MNNEYPSLFHDANGGGLARRCDDCELAFGDSTPFMVTKVVGSVLADGRRETRHEVALCPMCWAKAAAAITPQTRCKMMGHVDARIAERSVESELEKGEGYLQELVNRVITPADTPRIREHLRVCRFCKEDTLNPRLGGELDFVHTAVFRGGQLLVKTGRFMRFELPLTMCGNCDAEAAARLSAIQRDALDVVYARLDVDDYGFKPVLPFIAEHPLAV